MQEAFDDVDALGQKTNPDSMTFLQKLGAMHIAAAVGEKANSELDPMTDPVIQFYRNLKELVDNKGIPADWAFTICNLICLIHNYLRTSDKPDVAGLIRNFVFKDYAFQLRGIKRVAFFANLFANLHYEAAEMPDTTEDKAEANLRNKTVELPDQTKDKAEDEYKTVRDKIMEIGQYTLQRFCTDTSKWKNHPEGRIYLAFTGLIMADVEMQLKPSRESVQKSQEYIEKVQNYFSGSGDLPSQSLIGLREFLVLYSEMITNENFKMNQELLQYGFVLLPECRERYEKGIGKTSHDKMCDNRFVITWKKRLA